MPGKKIARKRPGSRCEADLALRTARALPPPPFFYGWLRTVRFQRPLVILRQGSKNLFCASRRIVSGAIFLVALSFILVAIVRQDLKV